MKNWRSESETLIERQLGLAGGDEEVGVLDAQQGDADEGEIAEEGDPGGPRHGGDLVDALDLGLSVGGHGNVREECGRVAWGLSEISGLGRGSRSALVLYAGRRRRGHAAATWLQTFEITTEPSPTAEATRLMEAARTSPTAKTPGQEVA